MPEEGMKQKSNLLKVFDKNFQEGKITEKSLACFSVALIFIISSTYLYWFGNGIFFCQENKSLFIYSVEYFQKFANKPGGLLVYAGNFLTQGYFSSLYGSFIVSSLLALLCIVLRQIARHFAAASPFSLLFILLPSGLLLLLQTRYDLYIQHILGYLLVSAWFLVSIIAAKRNHRFIIPVLFPLFFYLVGSYAWIYLGMSVIFSVIYEKEMFRYMLPVFLTVIAFITLILFQEVLFLQPFERLSGYPLFFNETSRLTSLMYLLSGFMVLFPLIVKTPGIFTVSKKISGVINLASILTFFTAVVFLLVINYDPVYANVMQIEKSVYMQDWDDVISKHEKHPSSNIIAQYYYNLALSEKNQLCNRMFFGPQNFGPMSLTLTRDNKQAVRAIYFYYAIGLISEAHHLAYESMVQHGYTPENIKMLIKTELINGNYKVAGRYLNVLKKTLHYKRWAEKYEKMLQDRALISSDPELGEKIRMLPKKDFFIGTDDARNIELFLNENPDNKRAFEYKIARLLLEKDMIAVVDEVKKMSNIGYTEIPRHIEEVVVAYKNLSKESPDLGGLTVRDGTDQRFFQYRSIYNACRGNKSLIEKKLGKADRNTFWYYLQFGIIKSDFLENNPENNSIY
jgi:hypothetical protein